MKSSYLVSEIKKIFILAISVSVVALFFFKMANAALWVEAIVVVGIQCVSAVYIVKLSKKFLHILPHISMLTKEVGAGRFEQRITYIDDSTELGRIALELNDMLDQLEAFFREVKTTTEYISLEKFFRKIQPSGLHGQFCAQGERTRGGAHVSRRPRLLEGRVLPALPE